MESLGRLCALSSGPFGPAFVRGGRRDQYTRALRATPNSVHDLYAIALFERLGGVLAARHNSAVEFNGDTLVAQIDLFQEFAHGGFAVKLLRFAVYFDLHYKRELKK